MCDGYNAMDSETLLSIFNAESSTHFMHPYTFEWALNDLARSTQKNSLITQYAEKKNRDHDDCRTCFVWKLKFNYNHPVLRGMASRLSQGRRLAAEYGIYGMCALEGGSGINDAEMRNVYRQGLTFNGTQQSVEFVLSTWAPALERELSALVNKHVDLKSTSKYQSYWCKKAFKTPRDVEQFIERYLRPDGNDPYAAGALPKIKWIKGWPISVAVYQPGDLGRAPTLTLHEWLIRRSRRVDVLILALHEIVGHHHQETRRGKNTSAQAENCAMSCEKLVADITGNEKAVVEWRCARLCRALLDIRMHLGYNTKDYPNPEYVWRHWDRQLGGPFKFIIPLPSETLRVAALPGQALGYVPACSEMSCPDDRGVHCNAVCSSK